MSPTEHIASRPLGNRNACDATGLHGRHRRLARRPGGFRCRRPRRALPQLRVTLAQLEAAINEGFAARDMAAMVPYMEDKTR